MCRYVPKRIYPDWDHAAKYRAHPRIVQSAHLAVHYKPVNHKLQQCEISDENTQRVKIAEDDPQNVNRVGTTDIHDKCAFCVQRITVDQFSFAFQSGIIRPGKSSGNGVFFKLVCQQTHVEHNHDSAHGIEHITKQS